MFMRLTCYLQSNDLIPCYSTDIVGSSDGAEFLAPSCILSDGVRARAGACSGRPVGLLVSNDFAPGESEICPKWTTSPVDTAGWTQVVIQKGSRDLSDVSTDPSGVMVNASIDRVVGHGIVGQRFERVENEVVENSVLNGHAGLPIVYDSSFSCSNNNEVTI